MTKSWYSWLTSLYDFWQFHKSHFVISLLYGGDRLMTKDVDSSLSKGTRYKVKSWPFWSPQYTALNQPEFKPSRAIPNRAFSFILIVYSFESVSGFQYSHAKRGLLNEAQLSTHLNVCSWKQKPLKVSWRHWSYPLSKEIFHLYS